LDDLCPEEIVALLSTFVFQEKETIEPNLTPTLATVRRGGGREREREGEGRGKGVERESNILTYITGESNIKKYRNQSS